MGNYRTIHQNINKQVKIITLKRSVKGMDTKKHMAKHRYIKKWRHKEKEKKTNKESKKKQTK